MWVTTSFANRWVAKNWGNPVIFNRATYPWPRQPDHHEPYECMFAPWSLFGRGNPTSNDHGAWPRQPDQNEPFEATTQTKTMNRSSTWGHPSL